jgi:hypothetical protein
VTVATVRANSATTMTLQPSSTASALKPDARRPSALTRSPGFAPPACARQGVDAHGRAACSASTPARPATTRASRSQGRARVGVTDGPAGSAGAPAPSPCRRRTRPFPAMCPARYAPPTSVHRLSTGAHKLPVSPRAPPRTTCTGTSGSCLLSFRYDDGF